jgi:sulfate permease, SulP family
LNRAFSLTRNGQLKMKYMFKPKLFDTLKNYNRKQFTNDVLAGIIVGIVALPLAIAFGIASGVNPEKGLITAVVVAFIISAFGGSRVQIGGPTEAFIVIVYGIVQTYGIDGLIVATFMAGIILIILGFARAGAVIKFIPHPLIVGFISGIALIIFSSQIKDFLGLKMGAVPADFMEKWRTYFTHFGSINLYALLIQHDSYYYSLAKSYPKMPGSLIAILVTTLAVQLL